MKLTSMYLTPDPSEFRTASGSAFRNQTRFLCHYVQHYVAARKVDADGFKRICVVCKPGAAKSSHVNSSKVLVVELPFDMADYDHTASDELPEFFIGLLEAGLAKGGREHALPAALFKEAIDSFRAHGYRNTWVHATRRFRRAGLSASLLCELDMSCFRLVLEVERAGAMVFSQEILRTLPDELVFAHRFKDVTLDGTLLRVQGKSGDTLFELKVA